ncbi:MAG TPA: hypothetical protein VIJ39_11320 [Solirubrobacteraceae bacterium]
MRSHVSPQRAVALTLVLLAGMVGVLALSAGSALAVRGHVFSAEFGEACTAEPCGPGQFKEPSGVAVNEATGQVYVLDQGDNRVERFSSAGVYEAQFDGSGTPAKAFVFGSERLTAGIAIDNSTDSLLDPSAGDIYVTDSGHKVVDKFSSTGSYLGQLSETTSGSTFSELYGVAVDPSGLVWVYQSSGEIDSYSNALANEFQSARNSPFGASPGFAVDSEDNLYVNRGGKVVAKISSSGASLHEEVDGEETTAAAVNRSTDDVYLDNVTTIGRFTAAGSSLERFGSGDLTSGSGIGVNASNETLYVADSPAGVIDVFILESARAPTAENESISKVTANSATFQAEVNARGANTEYHFEYGRCASLSTCATSGYETSLPLPDAALESMFAVQGVSVHTQDLLPGTVYHFRVIAHNSFGTGHGVERTFVTQAAGVFTLPDGRSWEMVSPPQKEGTLFVPIEEGIIQAAANGDAFSEESLFEPIEENAASATGFYSASFFGRGADGWSAKTIAQPHSGVGPLPVGGGQDYRIFSEDLSKAILQPLGPFTSLAPGVDESTPYIRTDYLNGNPFEQCGSGCFQPIVSIANVPVGTKFGDEPDGKCNQTPCGPHVLGATPDLSHIVLGSYVALTSTPVVGRHRALYEWNGGRLELVNLLPEGEANKDGGSLAFESTLGEGDDAARHAISNDGSRIVLLAEQAVPRRGGERRHLYLRDTVRHETVLIDAPNADAPPMEGERRPQYMTASSDGARVFFLDSERLTADATANTNSESPDLYEYNVDAPVGSRLTDLTVDKNDGESADVSMVTGASEDGSYIYFTAGGALAPGAGPGACGGNNPQPGETKLCNLYVRHNGVTTFIAGLSVEDYPDWNQQLADLPARVSPNGRWLAFMSNRNLTGYDTADANSGRPDEEVYLYEARSGKVICASCNPTGARPVGFEKASEFRLVNALDYYGMFARKTWIAAIVPGWTPMDLSEARYQSRYLSDSGRLFFDSGDGLVPQDVNGTQDVYEFEPPGVGGCSSSIATFSESSGGCVAPVSSGTSNEESAFLDASESGGDVFFLTGAKLLPQDFDNSLDIYDARECTAVSPCISVPPLTPPPCNTGDSCKASPSPQPAIFGSPSSATFSGAGNVTAPVVTPVVKQKDLTRAQKLARVLKLCRKKKGKQRAVCERKARSRYSVKRSSKVNATKKGRG